MSEDMTTAAALGSFRKELIEHGFTPDEAFAMARDVASAIVREDAGLVVRNA